jgi:hypothetical protein
MSMVKARTQRIARARRDRDLLYEEARLSEWARATTIRGNCTLRPSIPGEAE